MNFVFLMDPLETVVLGKDTSFLLMLGAHRRGHKVFFLPEGGIIRRDGQLYFHATPVIPQLNQKRPFIQKSSILLKENLIDLVFIRTDPPFDEEYLLQTWLLDLLPAHIPSINSPKGVRSVNEKIWATQFSSLIPPTLIARHKYELLNFLHEHKEIVVKPTNGFGGRSVFRIKKGDLNTHVILETLTRNWKIDIIAQKYLPQSRKGDKRILLLDGEPLGAILRVHPRDDHRNNLFAGGKAYPAKITERDEEIIQILKPHLQQLGLHFIGIDIIGDYLIEVNVTSPTCLQEMNKFYRARLEDKIIAFAENLVDSLNKKARI